jgi:ankyrin repeat protein
LQLGETPLHRAANCGNAGAVAALLEAGADADAARNVRAALRIVPHAHARVHERA